MRTMIYCKPTEKGIHSFYLNNGSDDLYLFSQAYRKSVEAYYGKGVPFENATRYSKAHNDCAIMRTMSKIPMYIRYIEKEYGIAVLNKSKRNSKILRLRYV